MEAHPSATHVHVGCDEVFHLGECAECQGRNRNDIFVEHVSAVAKYVQQAHKRYNYMMYKYYVIGYLCWDKIWVWSG